MPSALLHVHRNHVDSEIRRMAGEAYDLVLSRRVVWDAYEIDFAARERETR